MFDWGQRYRNFTITWTRFGKYSFWCDQYNYIHVYTDGACQNNGKQHAAAGSGIWWADNHPLNRSNFVVERQTNQNAEIQAATKAIWIAADHGIGCLRISTDSKFLLNAVNKWMRKWKELGWRRTNGEPLKNEVSFRKLDEAICCNSNCLNIIWKYVPAHSNYYGNEEADKLARNAAFEYYDNNNNQY